MRRLAAVAIGILLFGWLAGAAGAAAPAQDPAELLARAERIKTLQHPQFVELLEQLKRMAAELPPAQQAHVRYLDAWQVAYQGDYAQAETMLGRVIAESADPNLRFRAQATSINILGLSHRYEEAFGRLNQMLDQLPGVSDATARTQGLGEASQLLIGAGQYEAASRYADQLLREQAAGESICKPVFLKLDIRYRAGRFRADDPEYQTGLDACIKYGDTVFANAMRADMAGFQIRQGQAGKAIALLTTALPSVVRDAYPALTSKFHALLAQAYWAQGDAGSARQHALDALAASVKSEYSEPLIAAYDVLWRVEQQAGRYREALAYHEKYMAADKGYLDDVSAKALAYQIVKQGVQAKKAEVDALARQNQILQLQQALDRKEVEASRLYIAMLALGLLAIGLWLLRLKRSQLEFMRAAQCDSLTGIYNRKHFMAEAESALRYAQRSGRGASLVLIDLDHFKLTNDTYGHAMGDQVLRRAVMACQEYVRSTDVFGRLGGEEFGVLLPECGLDGGIERAEAIRRAIAASGDQEDSGIPVSASFGVAFTGESGYELRLLLVDADHALYRAKRAGRNCVVAGKVGEGVVVA
jgi:diguanylate cyclase (GGDEF)-like protein